MTNQGLLEHLVNMLQHHLNAVFLLETEPKVGKYNGGVVNETGDDRLETESCLDVSKSLCGVMK